MSRAFGLCLLCLLALAGSARAARRPSPPFAPALPLSHAGRWITDSYGRVVIMHGVNMVYKVAPYFPAAVGFSAQDAAFLERIGFNAVRVGVIWKAVEPQPGVYDDAYLNHIAATVATLARHHILSLLDFHQDMYNEEFQGEGFPNWSVQDDGLPPQPQHGFPDNYELMPALQHAFDHFWANSPGPGGVGLQTRYAGAWRHVALRFRGNRHVLGYELMNEPFPGSQWQSCTNPAGCPAFDATLTAYSQRIDRAIRSVDRRTLVWYEPNVIFDFGARTDMGPIGDRRAGFSFHDYCFGYGASGDTSSCAQTGNLVVTNAISHVKQTGDALLMTEYGDSNYGLMRAMVRRDDHFMVPWLEWSYCPCHDPTGAASRNRLITNPSRPPRGSNLNRPALRILVEPYPQLVSGTPLSWGFDTATRTLHFRYSTARPDDRGSFPAGFPTEIATPWFVYHGQYAVTVRGGDILSRPGDPRLEVAACLHVQTVSVTVHPRGADRSSCRPAAP